MAADATRTGAGGEGCPPGGGGGGGGTAAAAPATPPSEAMEYLTDAENLAARKALGLDVAVPWQWKKVIAKVAQPPEPPRKYISPLPNSHLLLPKRRAASLLSSVLCRINEAADSLHAASEQGALGAEPAASPASPVAHLHPPTRRCRVCARRPRFRR